MNTTYRKKINNDTWHWCTNCRYWPKMNFAEITRSVRPLDDKLCEECLAMSKTSECQKLQSEATSLT